MATIRPGLTGRKIGVDLEPLAVSPRQACMLLGIGNTRLYQLIANGELVSYQEGRARRITMQSIRARVASLAAPAGAEMGDPVGAPPDRRDLAFAPTALKSHRSRKAIRD
jgi:excisionase family DNA binding protein